MDMLLIFLMTVCQRSFNTYNAQKFRNPDLKPVQSLFLLIRSENSSITSIAVVIAADSTQYWQNA